MNEEEVKHKIVEFRDSRNKEEFIHYFTSDKRRLDEILRHIWSLSEYPYKEYASWMFMHIVKSKKIDATKYYNKLVDTLFKTHDQTVLRNVVCCLDQINITDYQESELIDQLISFIQDRSNKVALQVYSIYLLIKFCKKYPELTQEILVVIMMNSEGKTAGYRIAIRNFHHELNIS